MAQPPMLEVTLPQLDTKLCAANGIDCAAITELQYRSEQYYWQPVGCSQPDRHRFLLTTDALQRKYNKVIDNQQPGINCLACRACFIPKNEQCALLFASIKKPSVLEVMLYRVLHAVFAGQQVILMEVIFKPRKKSCDAVINNTCFHADGKQHAVSLMQDLEYDCWLYEQNGMNTVRLHAHDGEADWRELITVAAQHMAARRRFRLYSGFYVRNNLLPAGQAIP